MAAPAPTVRAQRCDVVVRSLLSAQKQNIHCKRTEEVNLCVEAGVIGHGMSWEIRGEAVLRES